MIRAAKQWVKARWPALRLRAILLSVLIFAAGLPGISAIFLRVYENTLVRQTEAELIAQGAALSAAIAADWPGAAARPVRRAPADPDPPARSSQPRMVRGLPDAGYYEPDRSGYYQPEPLTIDLRTSPIHPPRPWRTPDATPAPDAQGAASGAAPVIAATSRTTLASIRLLDRNGVVAAGGAGEAGMPLGDLPEVKAAIAGRTMTLLRETGTYSPRYFLEVFSRAAGIRVHHARPVVVNGEVAGVLLLSRSPRGLFVGLYQDRGKIALGAAAIFLVLLVIAGLLSRAIARPIERLGAATREVAKGGGTVPETPPTAAVEIRALYADFAEMAAAIERRSRYLRDFAHAVSHEFKTPLAGISGAIELLEDHHADMSEADRRRFLANISADARRLSLLVSRLLDLARADMSRPDADATTPLGPLLHRLADGLSDDRFAVRIDSPADLPPAAIPEGALAAVLTGLIENSRQAGAATVRLGARAGAGRLRLRIEDDGPGIPAADRARIFEPFFTSRRDSGGTGLGLPIARSLIEAAHGTLDLAPTGSCRGTAIAIDLPAAPG